MEGNRLYQLYQQHLNWTEHRLQRYLIVRRNGDDTQMVLAIYLALLSHRLPFYARSKAILEEPTTISSYVVGFANVVSDADKRTSVEILCSMLAPYCREAQDSHQVQLVLCVAAKICLQIGRLSMDMLEAVSCLSKSCGRALLLEDIEELSTSLDVLAVNDVEAVMADADKLFQLKDFSGAAEKYAFALDLFVRQSPRVQKLAQCDLRIIDCLERLADAHLSDGQAHVARSLYARLYAEQSLNLSSMRKVVLFKKLALACRLLNHDDEQAHWEQMAKECAQSATKMGHTDVLKALATLLRGFDCNEEAARKVEELNRVYQAQAED
jgi:hypothetical protein